MAEQTLYIAAVLARGRNGWRQAHVAFEARHAAQRFARRLVDQGVAAGVLVARQTADPETGEYADPVILDTVGELPDR